ncbi:hypothetical protein EAY46_14920 [Vibrio anguillarum]|uniref:DUF3450 domain-containing protein n=2 Tax=Vibrio anguillarum TaxID=55601 RepID=A0ABR9Z7D3_VIBAN|nr:hypothetical protein [Vibrio anguillarum]
MFMKTKKSHLMLTLAVLMTLSTTAQSDGDLLSIGEFEKKQQDIMASNQVHEDKIKALNNLMEEFDAQAKLLEKFQAVRNAQNPQSSETNVSKTEVEPTEIAKQLDKSSAIIDKITNKVLNEVYLTELFVVGNIGQAKLITNNRVFDVDLNNAINKKRQYGNFTIKSFDGESITLINVETKKTHTLTVRSSEEILAQMKFNRDLLNKYQESSVMGQLDVDLKRQVQQNIPAPMPVVY